MISGRNTFNNTYNNNQVQFQHVIRVRNPTQTATGGILQSHFQSSHSYYNQSYHSSTSPSTSPDDRPNESSKITYSRRSHRKSRYGCRNCKNRRLKCDESKPECIRCLKHGIQCDYIFSQPQQMKFQSKSATTPLQYSDTNGHSMSPDTTTTNMSLVAVERSITELIGLDGHTGCLDGSSQLTNFRILNHFVNGSAESILNPKIKMVMKTGLIRSAFTSAHLMHTVLAAACLHLNRMQPGDKTREILEVYHWQRAVQLFQTELACTNISNVNVDNTESLIGSCLLLPINQFCPAGFKPEHSWVFTSNPADLNWLALQGGLRCILGITQPFVDASIWGPAFRDADHQLRDFKEEQPGRTGLRDELADLCDIDDGATAENNPYHWSVQLLSRMMALKPYNRPENYEIFVTWMGQILPEFITLLRGKDERALLVLSWWMALMCAVSSFQVWIYGRIVPECKAICKYLESTSTDPEILKLMRWPASACGYYDFNPAVFEDATFD